MNIKIRNEKISEVLSSPPDKESAGNIFIFALGYEERSIEIFNKYIKRLVMPKLCFLFDDYNKHEIPKKNKKCVEDGGVLTDIVQYSNYEEVIIKVKEAVSKIKRQYKTVNIHIDYSSMPRSWYCRLPTETIKELSNKDKIYFWYSKGEYSEESKSWPSAGIDDVEVLTGKASLRPINNRSHIFGLGFDHLRSQAIFSVLDPAYLISVYSYSEGDKNMRDKIQDVNLDLINSSAYSIRLPMDNLNFSISKLNETIKELLIKGDVILVPDGPKPLILALSIMPDIISRPGVICLHIKRNEKYFRPINVKATGSVFGFSLFKNDQ